jgi:predicted nucleic acid-binding protein
VRVTLDASMALAWHLKRVDPKEAEIAELAFDSVRAHGATVPALWYPEVANGLLVAERRRIRTVQETMTFESDLALPEITMDSASPRSLQPWVLSLSRSSHLTAYDATYLELALRTASTLATFDQKLAEAARSAGVPVFGDTP